MQGEREGEGMETIRTIKAKHISSFPGKGDMHQHGVSRKMKDM